MTAVSLAIASLLAATPYDPIDTIARFAVVVGNNESDDANTPPLRYADDDAVATHRLLKMAHVQSILLADLDKGTRSLNPDLTTQSPTLANLSAAMTQQRQAMEAAIRSGKTTEFLFFYSGHGDVEGGQGFVALRGDRLTRNLLYAEILAKSPAQQNHVIIDACKSYFLVFDRGPGGHRSRLPTDFVEHTGSNRYPNTGFVLSTSSERDSHEWERFQAGVFSHEVRSALWGAADANGDGVITYAELGAFLTNANAAIQNERFRPDFLVHPPGPKPGDIETSLLAWSHEATLVVDGDLGHFYVEDAAGTRVLDGHPAAGTSAAVCLPSERPMFVRDVATDQEYRIDSDAALRLSSVSLQPTQLQKRGAMHAAFASLFQLPFDTNRVREYARSYLEAAGPLERVSLHAATQHDHAPCAQRRLLWGGIGAAGVGGAMTSWAWNLNRSNRHESQHDKEGVNKKIHNLNTAAAISYALAGSALVTWLIIRRWPTDSMASISLAPAFSADMVSVVATVGDSP